MPADPTRDAQNRAERLLRNRANDLIDLCMCESSLGRDLGVLNIPIVERARTAAEKKYECDGDDAGHRPNENKISDGYPERAQIEVEMF